MRVEITERFLDDLVELQPHLSKKCRGILRELAKPEAKTLLDSSTPGWRVHKLRSSPFRTLSVDMNYRMLLKIEGDAAFVYRVVKHDVADSPTVNRNDAMVPVAAVSASTLMPREVISALLSIGLPGQYVDVLSAAGTENDLLDALGQLPSEWANRALDFYEGSQINIPRARYRCLQTDGDIDRLLKDRSGEWEFYLHPSQRFVADLPASQRAAVTGSAGTGKTVCAWHRTATLAAAGMTVGFVTPNENVLSISKERIKHILDQSAGDSYFLVSRSLAELRELATTVDHLIIDEGQEISPEWYRSVAEVIDSKQQRGGITIFYDLNQLRGNIKSGDHSRFDKRLSRWSAALFSTLRCINLCLTVNYRNSREIAAYYTKRLEDVLLEPLEVELAAFEAGDVTEYKVGSEDALSALLFECVRKLKRDFRDGEIAIIGLNTTVAKRLADQLQQLGIRCSGNPADSNRLCVTAAGYIRGYERKAVIVFGPSAHLHGNNVGHAISTYIACSRARDQLVIVETS